jgi:hypothetical protein
MKTTDELKRTIARQSKIIDEVYRVLHEESFIDLIFGERSVLIADIHRVLDGDETEDAG